MKRLLLIALLLPNLLLAYTANQLWMVPPSGGLPHWQSAMSSHALLNHSLSATVATNALTVSLITPAGTAPTSTNPLIVPFRDPTATTGTYTAVAVTSSTTLTVPSGTSLGTSNGLGAYLCVYGMNNGGTLALAISASCYWDEAQLQSSSAISGGSSATTLYSESALTSKPLRLLGRIYISEATAGTWASAPTEVSLPPFLPGRQIVLGANVSGNATTTSTSYVNLSNPVSVTFSAQRTALYRVSGACTISNSTAGSTTYVTIANTSGSALIRKTQDVFKGADGSGTGSPAYFYVIAQLQAGTAYTFNVQMKVNANTGTFAAGNTPGGCSLVAEEM